jgi:Mrp family chromosome partitioning ATPase
MLRRRLPLVVLAVVVALVGAYVFSKQEQKKYSSTAVLLFKPLLIDVQLTGLPLQVPSSDPQRDTATDIGLVTLPQVRSRAAALLGPGYTPDKLKKDVDVSSKGKSALVTIKGTATTPQAATAIANAMGDAFITYRRQTLVDRMDAAISGIRRELRQKGNTRLQKAVLRNNLTKLTQLTLVQPGDVEFVSRAQPPTKPSSPKTALNMIIGGLLGLVLGLAIALGVEAMDRRVRRPDDVEDALDLPVLAAIPRSKVLRKGAGLTTGLSGIDVEAFRLLRTNLRYRAGGRQIRSLLLTSAGAGSGKTTVAVNLAAAAAAATEGRVLLIEADLRRPRLGALLDLPPERGLAALLESALPLANVAIPVPIGEGSNGSGPNGGGSFVHSFDVLHAGTPHPNASELLSSKRMTEVIRAATETYELTIIDGPPPGLVSDAIPLMKQADGVVLVARLGRENSPELKRLRTQLARLGVAPLGVVANFSRRVSNPYVSSKRG